MKEKKWENVNEREITPELKAQWKAEEDAAKTLQEAGEFFQYLLSEMKDGEQDFFELFLNVMEKDISILYDTFKWLKDDFEGFNQLYNLTDCPFYEWIKKVIEARKMQKEKRGY